MDTCRGEGQCVVAGVRSPPLRDEANPNVGRLASKNPETTRRAVFSEGRTLCVRLARLDVNRGRW